VLLCALGAVEVARGSAGSALVGRGGARGWGVNTGLARALLAKVVFFAEPAPTLVSPPRSSSCTHTQPRSPQRLYTPY
jgi:hypothetical protein